MSSFAATPIDAVTLKPAWSTLLSSLRFARNGSWHFGNNSATMRVREPTPRRWLTGRPTGDALRFRFDLHRWHTAFARSTGMAREIGIVADDGSAIASIHLEQVDAAIDELIWRLIDDEVVPALKPSAARIDIAQLAGEFARAESRVAFDELARQHRLARADALTLAGPAIARPLAPTVLPRAFGEAQRAGLRLRVRLENVGGGVIWQPLRIELDSDAAAIVLTGGDIRVTIPAPGASSIWAVALETPDACCPAIECCAPGDHGWIRIDVAADTTTACATWRRICATLPEE